MSSPWKHSTVFKPTTNLNSDQLQQWSQDRLIEQVKLLQDYINTCDCWGRSSV